VRNEGPGRIYWLRVHQEQLPLKGDQPNLVFHPPQTVFVLEKGQTVTLRGQVSALASYHFPRPAQLPLKLHVVSGQGELLQATIPVDVAVPQFELDKMALSRSRVRSVLVGLEGMAFGPPQRTSLDAQLYIDAPGRAQFLDSLMLQQTLRGQDLQLTFLLPQELKVDKKTRMTLLLRKVQHPSHQWTFDHVAVYRPIPYWIIVVWLMTVSLMIGLILYFKVYQHPWVLAVAEVILNCCSWITVKLHKRKPPSLPPSWGQ
jgi:hypothetical protein